MYRATQLRVVHSGVWFEAKDPKSKGHEGVTWVCLSQYGEELQDLMVMLMDPRAPKMMEISWLVKQMLAYQWDLCWVDLVKTVCCM